MPNIRRDTADGLMWELLKPYKFAREIADMTEEPPLTVTCPKCGALLIAAAELQPTDMLKCPKHGDVGTLSELLDQTLQRQMGNALKDALEKDDKDGSA
jgi:hypothetical protein